MFLAVMFLTASISHAKTVYRIQVQSTASINNAQKVKDELTRKNYSPVYIIEQGGLFKVQIGDYESREAAIPMLDRAVLDIYPDSFLTIFDSAKPPKVVKATSSGDTSVSPTVPSGLSAEDKAALEELKRMKSESNILDKLKEARLKMDLNAFESAIDSFNEALALDPNNVEATRGIVKARQQIEIRNKKLSDEKAAALTEQEESQQAKVAAVQKYLADAGKALQAEEWDKASEAAVAALVLDPGNSQADSIIKQATTGRNRKNQANLEEAMNKGGANEQYLIYAIIAICVIAAILIWLVQRATKKSMEKMYQEKLEEMKREFAQALPYKPDNVVAEKKEEKKDVEFDPLEKPFTISSATDSEIEQPPLIVAEQEEEEEEKEEAPIMEAVTMETESVPPPPPVMIEEDTKEEDKGPIPIAPPPIVEDDAVVTVEETVTEEAPVVMESGSTPVPPPVVEAAPDPAPAPVPTAAGNSVIYSISFDDQEVGSVPPEWNGSFPNASLVVSEEDGVKCLKFEKNSGVGSAHYFCNFPDAAGKLEVEYDIRFDNKNKYFLGFYIENDKNFREAVHTILYKTDENTPPSLRLNGEPTPYEMKAWRHVKFDLDLEKGLATGYIDGEQIFKELSISGSPRKFNTFSIRDNIATTGVMLLNNIVVRQSS